MLAKLYFMNEQEVIGNIQLKKFCDWLVKQKIEIRDNMLIRIWNEYIFFGNDKIDVSDLEEDNNVHKFISKINEDLDWFDVVELVIGCDAYSIKKREVVLKLVDLLLKKFPEDKLIITMTSQVFNWPKDIPSNLIYCPRPIEKKDNRKFIWIDDKKRYPVNKRMFDASNIPENLYQSLQSPFLSDQYFGLILSRIISGALR